MSFDCFVAQKLEFIPKTENVIAIAVYQTRFTCICPLMPCVFLLKASTNLTSFLNYSTALQSLKCLIS